MCVVTYGTTGSLLVSTNDTFVNAKCFRFPAFHFARFNMRPRGIAYRSHDFVAAYATACFGGNVLAVLEINQCRWWFSFLFRCERALLTIIRFLFDRFSRVDVQFI